MAIIIGNSIIPAVKSFFSYTLERCKRFVYSLFCHRHQTGKFGNRPIGSEKFLSFTKVYLYGFFFIFAKKERNEN